MKQPRHDLLRCLLLSASCMAGLLPQAQAHYLCVDRWGHRYTVADLPFDNVDGLQCKAIPKPMVFAPGPGAARRVSPAPAPVAAAEPFVPAAAPAVVPEVRTAVRPNVTEVSAGTASVAPAAPARSGVARPTVPPVVRLGPVRTAVTPSEMAGIFGFPLQGSVIDDRIGGLNARP